MEEREKNWRRNLKIGIVALVLLFLIGGVITVAKADKSQPLVEKRWPEIPLPEDSLSKMRIVPPEELNNIADPRHPDYGKIPLPTMPRMEERFPFISPNPGESDYGTLINISLENITGVYAGQEVQSTLSLPSAPPNRTLYAPTLIAPNYAPLEAVTAYWRYTGMSTTGRGFGVWDHTAPSGSNWVAFIPIDSTFLNKYVRSYPEGNLYFVQVKKPGTTWIVSLYNFNLQVWDVINSSTASSSFWYGWDIWESYFNGTCPSLPNIGSDYLRVYKNRKWQNVTSTYGSQLDYQSCAYQERMISPYYHWSVGP